MNPIRAGQIALLYVAHTMAEGASLDLDFSNEVMGQWALKLAKAHFFKKNWRFDGLKSEIGRARVTFAGLGMSFSQEELHQFLIEEIFPYLIAEGLTATGEIHFKWSKHKD